MRRLEFEHQRKEYRRGLASLLLLLIAIECTIIYNLLSPLFYNPKMPEPRFYWQELTTTADNFATSNNIAIFGTASTITCTITEYGLTLCGTSGAGAVSAGSASSSASSAALTN